MSNRPESSAAPGGAAPPATSAWVQRLFEDVPPTYERINHVLTLGLDIVWRKRAAKIAAAAGGTRWLDLCTGTGETAVYLARLAPGGTSVFAVDFSLPMLNEARRKREAGPISFLASDIRALPFPNESMDVVTMSFALRSVNLNREVLNQSLAEFHRVLKRGGRFVNLETSQPPLTPLRRFRNAYVRAVVESIGRRLSGAGTAYAFLARTIPVFHPAEEISSLAREAGFARVSFRRLLAGVAAIHEAVKD